MAEGDRGVLTRPSCVLVVQDNDESVKKTPTQTSSPDSWRKTLQFPVSSVSFVIRVMTLLKGHSSQYKRHVWVIYVMYVCYFIIFAPLAPVALEYCSQLRHTNSRNTLDVGGSDQ